MPLRSAYALTAAGRHEGLGGTSPDLTPTTAAIEDAGRLVFEARRIRDSLSVEEAAQRAVRPGGLSYEELVEKIRAQRAHWPTTTTAA